MRRILVTGANKGIGKATCIAILSHAEDTVALLGSRSSQRGQAAVDSIIAEQPQWASRLALLELDVTDEQSAQGAAAEVRQRYRDEGEPLYGIVNNAGIGLGSNALEAVLAANVWGIHRVSQAFLPLIDRSIGRIVNITSASGPNFVSRCSPGRQAFFTDPGVEWSELQVLMADCLGFERGDFEAAGLADGDAYGLSKAIANCYTMWLAREHPSLCINACTPGWIETDLTRPRSVSTGKSPAQLGMKPPSEGTRAPLFLLFGEPDGSGHYYGSDAMRSPLDRYREPGSPPYTGD